MRAGGPDVECIGWVNDLSALALHALSGSDRDRLIRHLQGCTACSTEFESWAVAAEALYTLVPSVFRTPDLASKVVERIAREGSSTQAATGRRPRLGSPRHRRSP